MTDVSVTELRGARPQEPVSPGRPRPRWTAPRAPRGWSVEGAAAVLVTAAWAVVVLGHVAGSLDSLTPEQNRGLAAGWPSLLGMLVLFARPSSPPWLRFCFGAGAVLAIAVIGLPWAGDSTSRAMVPLAVAAAGVAVSGRELWAMAALVALAAAMRSLQAYAPIGVNLLTEGLVIGLCVAAVHGMVVGRIAAPRWVPPTIAVVAAWLFVSTLGLITAPVQEAAILTYRNSTAYMVPVVLAAVIFSRRADRVLLHRLILCAAALAGLYSMLRWQIGPAAAESSRLVDPKVKKFVSDEFGDLRLFGSLGSPQALGIWSGSVLAMSVAAVLAPVRTSTRALALLCGATAVGSIIGADVRAAMVGAAVGLGVTLVLVAGSRGYGIQRILPLAAAAMICVVAVGGIVVAKSGEQSRTSERFENILTPFEDRSVQDRLAKWRSIFREIEDQPFGVGLGSATGGGNSTALARFESTAVHDPDSSYVAIAYDMGIAVMLLFIAACLALLAALARAALAARRPENAMIAVGACGALASYVVAMVAGTSYGIPPMVFVWVLAGLALAPVMARESEDDEDAPLEAAPTR